MHDEHVQVPPFHASIQISVQRYLERKASKTGTFQPYVDLLVPDVMNWSEAKKSPNESYCISPITILSGHQAGNLAASAGLHRAEETTDRRESLCISKVLR